MAKEYLQAGVYWIEPITGNPFIEVDSAQYQIPNGYAFTIYVKDYLTLDNTEIKYSKLPNGTVSMAKG
tara:strand:- start:212 stop:415 length:204 start_codon:yes stop_codon:yes gene_type:complete